MPEQPEQPDQLTYVFKPKQANFQNGRPVNSEDVKLPGHDHHPRYGDARPQHYAKVVGRENVIVGNDCDFSSQAVYKPDVDARVVWAKFEALAKGARLATKALWN